MADDQVKYSDLISEDVAAGFELLNNTMKELKETMAALKTEATGLGSVIKGMGTATREQQKSISDNAAAVDKLNKKMKDLSDEEQRLEAVSRRYKKLTDEQVKSVDAFQQAMQGTAEEQIKAASAIDVQVKSYNELQATYNALKDTLNAMTTAERESSQAGKVMTTTAMTIRDKMNELQKATGNYTLQVGKYKAAFDGLGFSFMQIAREAPSALNLNQFFLAISNNLPLFFDQIDRFKTEQKEIKQTLADLAAQGKQTSDEYIKIANQQTTVFKRLTQAIFSMQGAVLVFTMILRFLPKIVDWFKKVFNSTNELSNGMRTLKSVVLDIDKAVISAENDTVAALRMINERIKDLKPGTDDYVTAVRMVNELTKSTLDETKAMPAEVEKVTAAYIEMQRKLAENAELQRLISRSNAGKAIRDIVMDRNAGSAADRAAMIGGENQGRIQELLEYFEKYKPIEEMSLWDFIRANIGYGGSFNGGMLGKASELDRLINQSLGILDEDVEKKIRQRFNIIATQEEQKRKQKEPKEPTEESVSSRYWEAQEALLREQYKGYQLEQQLAKLNRDKALAEQTDWYEEQKTALAKNLKNHFITEQEYDTEIAELDRQNKAILKGIDTKYWADLRALRSKNLKERKDEWKANADEVEKTEKENAKTRLKGMVDAWQKRRAELVKEGASRREIVEAEVAAEIARLKVIQELNRDINGEKMSDEQRQKVEEWINLLEKLQQTGNYGDYKPGQFMGKGGANVTNGRKNYANIWEVLGIDMDNNQISALDSVFDQAKAALNSWMDARKAAADQAKELADDEVSAAENALNREIELRNQGYANDVALKERELADAKERQKKALEMQEKAKEEELALNTAMEASSMAVAIANLFKQFPIYVAIPLAATLLGAFSYAKLSALSQIRSTKYREGGVMLLEGGSHESGHDVNLGIGPDGSNLRAEGGEYFAVINKRNSRKYGSEIPAVVNALNSGMFEDRYIKTSDAVGLLPRIIRADDGSMVDLSAVESGVGELVKQRETSYNVVGDYMEIRYKNRVRRVKIN